MLSCESEVMTMATAKIELVADAIVCRLNRRTAPDMTALCMLGSNMVILPIFQRKHSKNLVWQLNSTGCSAIWLSNRLPY